MGDDAIPVEATDGAGVSVVCNRILSSAEALRFADSCGDWASIVCRAYMYPAGAGLGWHRDRTATAAFIYYAHPEWRNHWGGELLVAQGAGMRQPIPRTADAMSFESLYKPDERFDLIQSGSFIVPKPNRLVLIRGGALHMIKKTEPSIGFGFRASLSGFFIR